MKYIQLFLVVIKKFLFESRDYILYTFDCNKINKHSNDDDIKTYSKYSDIPDFIKEQLFIYPLFNPLYYRIKTQQAFLISIHNNKNLIAYGWIQSWKPFKRKFGWVFKDALMLGPYWTDSRYRGQGYYGRLLKHSISIASKEYPLFIYTTTENISSQKGINKMGFEKKGIYKISLVFRFFQWHKEIG